MIFNATGSLFDCIRTAASCLTGFARRQFQAKVARELCDASPRRAETLFGWNRNAVQRGLDEVQLGMTIKTVDDMRGRPKSEDADPAIAMATDLLLNENSQADPKFQSSYTFTRMTGERLREALAEQLAIPIARLPVPRTLRDLMNRRGFSLKKVRKTIPLKKIAKTDEIFANVTAAHERARKDPTILRISIDNKAKVKIGPFARGGKSRKEKDRHAADHDTAQCDRLTPCGILEIESGQLTIGMVVNTSTSDTVADNLEQWWLDRKAHYPHIRKLMIDLDNGPDVSSRRTQFMKRLVEWADRIGLKIELVYYPPYHSKYNRIERCWSALERHWNGSILTSIQTTLKWAQSMTWRAVQPIVRMLDRIYSRGVKLTKKEFAPIADRLQRQIGIEKWSLIIEPMTQLATT
jgi:hypothetical protein